MLYGLINAFKYTIIMLELMTILILLNQELLGEKMVTLIIGQTLREAKLTDYVLKYEVCYDMNGTTCVATTSMYLVR